MASQFARAIYMLSYLHENELNCDRLRVTFNGIGIIFVWVFRNFGV